MFSQSGCLTAQTLTEDGIKTAGANIGKGEGKKKRENYNDKKKKERLLVLEIKYLDCSLLQ